MAQISIRKKHCLGRQGARRTADKLASSLAEEYRANCSWQGDELLFSSTGVSGKLQVTEQEVAIDVNLGLMLRPLKAKIESGIVARLDEILDDDSIA